MKGYSFKEFQKILEDNNWKIKSCKGDHYTFEKNNTLNIITVPYRRKEICRPLAKRLLKEAGINQ